MAQQTSCYPCRIVLVVLTVVWTGLAAGSMRSAWGNNIVWYQGSDGRIYFTNLPPSPSPMLPAPLRPSSMMQRAGADGTLFAMRRLARQYNVDPNLVQAIITVESNFNPRAVSRAGALGLMQLMPQTAARYQVDNPFNPEANIEGGIRYLCDLFQLFPEDLRLVLAAYNAGEGAVQQYGGIPPYPETQRYVTRVMTLYGSGAPPAQGKIYRYRTVSGAILFTDTPR
jgi:soluble lytic murein transglycosylase-like protein